jgi:hypothetical protein
MTNPAQLRILERAVDRAERAYVARKGHAAAMLNNGQWNSARAEAEIEDAFTTLWEARDALRAAL